MEGWSAPSDRSTRETKSMSDNKDLEAAIAKPAIDLEAGRRAFLKTAGMGTALAALAAVGSGEAQAATFDGGFGIAQSGPAGIEGRAVETVGEERRPGLVVPGDRRRGKDRRRGRGRHGARAIGRPCPAVEDRPARHPVDAVEEERAAEDPADLVSEAEAGAVGRWPFCNVRTFRTSWNCWTIKSSK